MAKPTKLKYKDALTGYAFISIWLVGFLVFSLFPLVYSFYLSLNNVVIGNGIKTTPVGLQNYYQLFTLDMEFLRNMLNYFTKVIISIPLIIILSMIIAMLLNSKIKGQTVFRAIFFLPVIIISGPVLDIFTRNLVFESILNFDNISLLRAIENSPYESISFVVIFLVSNIADILWYTGVPILIFITGFQRLPFDMYEAAFIDGASGWQSFWKLTLPSLVGYIAINIIFSIIQISTMDSMPIINTISTRMFEMRYGFGYAASIAWVYFLAMLLVIGFFLFLTMLPGMAGRRKNK